MTLFWSRSPRGWRFTARSVALPALLALSAPASYMFAAPAEGAASTASHNLLLVRLRASLKRLFQEPEKILEIGIRKPPKELEESRRELRRFFAGATLEGVEVPFEGGDLASGRLGDVTATLTDLTLLGMNLDQAVFTLRGMEVDGARLLETGELQIRDLDSIRMGFRVTQEALNAVTSSYRIRVSPGRFQVSGKKKLLVLPVGFVAAGKLAFDEAGSIYFHDRSMTLMGLPLPGFFRSVLRKRINPIFDLEGYLGVAGEVLRVEFLGIRHGRGFLTLEAIARVDLAGDGAADRTNLPLAP